MKTLTDATAVGGEKQKMVLNSPWCEDEDEYEADHSSPAACSTKKMGERKKEREKSQISTFVARPADKIMQIW